MTCNIPPSWETAWIVPIIKDGKLSSVLGSYRPVSLLSCVAKLFERLLLYRPRWFLEGNDLLSPEQTGFRSHLGAQDNIIDFKSAVEHHRAIGEYTLAVFLDVKKAYDRIGADIAVASLRSMGIRGRLLWFLGGYLQGGSIRVKLGSTVSSSRLLHVGLPKGSVLSPLLFNMVMARVAPCILSDHLLSTTIYVDDVCLWSSGVTVSPLQHRLQPALNRLWSKPVTAAVRPISRTRHHHFFGVVDARDNGGAHVRAVQSAIRCPANAIRRLCHARWGSSPPALLHLHNALVASRITYGLPYLSLSETQQLVLERLHRAGV